MKYLIRIPLALFAIGVAFVAAVTAVCIGGYYYVAPSVPQAEDLKNLKIQQPLQVLTRDGRLIQEYGDRRYPVDYADVPPLVVKAILATEDEFFFEHPGIDYRGILRGIINLLSGSDATVGGSTITQQLPRTVQMFPRAGTLRGMDAYVQKFVEWIFALRIEREFTKEEILELYLNTAPFGQGAYGVAAAALTYFGKSLDELTLSEVAIIAGIPQRPRDWNPVASVENARNRRNYVLRRLRETEAIDTREHEAALVEPVVARRFGPRREVYAPFVAEMGRLFAVKEFGDDAMTDGYRVVMTVDSSAQRAANAATRATLRAYDERHGYKGPLAQVDLTELDGLTPEDADRRIEEWLAAHRRELDMRPALVTSVTPEAAEVRFARDENEELTATIGLDAVDWARAYINDDRLGNAPETVADVLAPGDVVFFRRDAAAGGAWRLAQSIEVEGALVAVDPRDGAIVALTGGSDYETKSKFNRAVQGGRQAGSTFKPLVFSAALDNGFTLATIVPDIKLTVEWDPGLEGPWRPDNFANDYRGEVRVRQALVSSLNAASIRILQGIGGSAGPAEGYRRAAEHVRRFGFNESEAPAVGGLVLGVGEVTPAKLATAFAAFANGGYRLDYYYVDRIETYDGKVVYESQPSFACGACDMAPFAPPQQRSTAQRPPDRQYGSVGGAPAAAAQDEAASTEIVWPPVPPELAMQLAPPVPAERAISAQNAYLVTDAMRGVIREGSGNYAWRELQRRDIAGKTGTTNDGKDAWFVGFTDEIVAAAWVGFDLPRSLGAREQGGRTAIPMWTDFMREALAGVPDVVPPRPPGIVEARINPRTGELASDLNCDAIVEIFEYGRLPRRESDSRYSPDGCGPAVQEGPAVTGEQTPQPSTSSSGRGGDIF